MTEATNAMVPGFKELTGTVPKIKIVDIGANPIDGEAPYSPLLRAGLAHVVGFEPNPEALAKLEAQKGPNDVYLPHAVGDGTSHTLNVCAAPGMTSLLPPNSTVLNLFHGFPHWGNVVATQEVDTVRLDDVPETAGLDLLKIDIQGGELMVFQNAEQRLNDALVIQSEVEFLPMYQGQPLFSDVDQFLRRRGFVLHRFFPEVSRVIQPLLVDNNIYAGLSQIVWADAIFVRDFTRLDLLNDRQLLNMAAILHECYRSFDLVLHVLIELDRRTQNQLAANYLARLTGKAPTNGLAA
ncbi:MAG TPA: FkbM family methyltransferase [Alphaproteobacteria bacterium]|nr:FkbM family methyltransferase [Alphaproteobacteria bacterium]